MALEKSKTADVTEEAIQLLAHIQEPVTYNLKRRAYKAGSTRTKRIPFLSRVMHDAGESGDALMQLGQSFKSIRDTTGSIESGFQFGAVSLAALDFVLIPVVYLGAYILGEEVPISINNNMRWLYAGVLLALAITAIVVPVAAPIIALVSATLTMGLSLFLLGQALHERHLLKKDKKELKKIIDSAEYEMQLIQEEARVLAANLQNTSDEETLYHHYSEVPALMERYNSQKNMLAELKERQFLNDQKIKEMHFTKILDKSVGVTLAAISIVGIVVSFFFPPVGLGILAAASVVSLTYIAARLAAPLFKTFGNWVAKKLHLESDKTTDESLEQKNANVSTNSTAAILNKLNENKKTMTKVLKKEPKDPLMSYDNPVLITQDKKTPESTDNEANRSELLN